MNTRIILTAGSALLLTLGLTSSVSAQDDGARRERKARTHVEQEQPVDKQDKATRRQVGRRALAAKKAHARNAKLRSKLSELRSKLRSNSKSRGSIGGRSRAEADGGRAGRAAATKVRREAIKRHLEARRKGSLKSDRATRQLDRQGKGTLRKSASDQRRAAKAPLRKRAI